MAIINGELKDINMQIMAEKRPIFIFTPQEGGADGRVIYSTEPYEFAPAYATGYFSAEVADTETTGILYDLAIQWQARPPTPNDYGFARQDIYSGLFIPASGGQLADLIKTSPGRWMTWVGPTPPPNPELGNSWLNSITGDYAVWE